MFLQHVHDNVVKSSGVSFCPTAQAYISQSFDGRLINRSYNASFSSSISFKNLLAKLPRRRPFSSMPLFLDWYISRFLLSSIGSLNFSMYSGIQGSLLGG